MFYICSIFSSPGSPTYPLNPENHIDEDLKTDKDEVYSELDKDELVKKLQEEFYKSAKGKWQMLQKLVTTGQIFIKHAKSHPKYSSHIQVIGQNHDRGRTTSSTPTNTKKTVIPVHHGKQNGFHTESPQATSITPKQTSRVKFDTRYC